MQALSGDIPCNKKGIWILSKLHTSYSSQLQLICTKGMGAIK